LAVAALLLSCQSASAREHTGGHRVDARALLGAAGNTADWLTTGRTYDEQRYSPLAQINDGNVKDLGLAWYADLDTARGQEATPLVIDGKIYITTAWSKVKAYDGATGRLLWEYDPKVPGATAVRACCDVVNRGLAAWGERLYFATLDGRLIALARDTGKLAWSVMTVDPAKPYTVTGAPRIIDGRVIIGNGGAEMGVRGYITAYDATNGRQLWRFYTVPDKPGSNEPAYLRRAEATWKGEWWTFGGGGTVWDSMAYDPKLDLLYIGVGNGSPWNQSYRSPGGGDNLYLSSIVALRPRTGEYAWHYQTTPGETWDFTATQHLILADLAIGGERRKVLMQAPKNGFFYVLDRVTGKLISAHNYAPVNWATGIDPQTGRPVENPDARIDKTGKPFVVVPGPGGAHNWQPMAYHPGTGLVYIPVSLGGFPYVPEANWQRTTQGFNTGIDFGAAAMPADPKVRAGIAAVTKGALVAWDPVNQKERWRADLAGPWNGGVLATGGGLVFQGNSQKQFAAYDAAAGTKLWSANAQTGVIAAPITYSIKGEQYVAVLAGWGGIWALAPGILSEVAGPVRNISRLLVYKLGGKAELPPEPAIERLAIDPPPATGSAEQLASGSKLYGRYCSVCHGDAAYGSTLVPDLRRSKLLGQPDVWTAVVHDGALQDRGMVGFASVLDAQQIESVRRYVIKRANEDKLLGAQ
jgi:quinohemoprotein ethanol dehydrogenase